jgi:hypothetical protein
VGATPYDVVYPHNAERADPGHAYPRGRGLHLGSDEQIFGLDEQILRHDLRDQQAERRVASRPHGRGHGTLVSHSTDVGCISEENKVKKLLLMCAFGIAFVGSANASWVLIPGDTTDRNLHGCGSSWETCKSRRIQRSQSGCDATCRAKCDATWRGWNGSGKPLKSAQECYVKWERLNRIGKASECERANNSRQRISGC